MECTQLSLFGRTCPEHFPATAEKILEPCWKNLPAWNSQTLLFLDLRGGADGAKPEQSPETDGLWLGDSLTLNIGECPREENVSLLSQILEVNAPEKYFLSVKACRGILTRASRRGKALPELLKTALLEMIEWWETDATASQETLLTGLKRQGQMEWGATENVSYTLNTVDRHAVAYSFDSLASNSMKSSNPYSGCREVELARTLDTSIPDPSKNQGGIAIVEPVAYTIKIRSGREGGGKGALVQTEKSATLSTLQDQTLFQPVVYDARGNGDGKIVPTITGDHESRITDYTAIVTEPEDCLTPWDNQARRIYSENGTFPALAAREKAGQNQQSVLTETEVRWIVRRLTPTECERLQGYPDCWTDIGKWADTKGKKHKPADTPRYKALGNSIALPQWFWIAQKMKLYLSANATLGSLFDGIGGFPLVWETTYGKGTARWASEIDSFCIAVTKKRFSNVEENK
jgi:DNA (cytosine-5)-methyltransferase 1